MVEEVVLALLKAGEKVFGMQERMVFDFRGAEVVSCQLAAEDLSLKLTI